MKTLVLAFVAVIVASAALEARTCGANQKVAYSGGKSRCVNK